MKLEVRNETKRKVMLVLCFSKASKKAYLHIIDKRGSSCENSNQPTIINPDDYAEIDSKPILG